MRLLSALAVLVLTVSLLPGQAEQPKPFRSQDGRFAAGFPSPPKESVRRLTVGTEEIAVHSATVEGKDHAFLVIWNDMPPAARGAPARAVLDGAVNGAKNKGTVAESKETTFGPGKLPARWLVLDTDEKKRFRILLVLREDRLYQVMVGGSKEFVAGPRAEAFLKSFELAK